MQIIIALVVLGLILYLIDMLPIKTLIHVLAIVLAILYVLRMFAPGTFYF